MTEEILEILSERVIDAPREKVFGAFSDPQKLARWWGPKGFTNTFELFEFRPGGDWKFVMHGPGGKDFPNHIRFLEIVRPERIVFDHLGTVHPFRMTMRFEELAGKTKLTWRMQNFVPAEFEKIKTFAPQANEQNFDKLEAVLKQG